jgi:hypothetical protein
MHFADASMWILLASLVAGFNIRPLVKDGKPILPSGKFADGSIRYIFLLLAYLSGLVSPRCQGS